MFAVGGKSGLGALAAAMTGIDPQRSFTTDVRYKPRNADGIFPTMYAGTTSACVDRVRSPRRHLSLRVVQKDQV